MSSTQVLPSSNHNHKDVDDEQVMEGVGVPVDVDAKSNMNTISNKKAPGAMLTNDTTSTTCIDRSTGAATTTAIATTKRTTGAHNNNVKTSTSIDNTENIQGHEHSHDDDIRDEVNYVRRSRQITSTSESSSESCTSTCNNSINIIHNITNVDSMDMEGSRCQTVREQNSSSPSTGTESSGDDAFLSITNRSSLSSSLSPTSSSLKRMSIESSSPLKGPLNSNKANGRDNDINVLDKNSNGPPLLQKRGGESQPQSQPQPKAQLTFSNSILQLASNMDISYDDDISSQGQDDNKINPNINSNLFDDDDDLSYSCGASTSTYSSKNTGTSNARSKNMSNANTNSNTNTSGDDSSSISTNYSKDSSIHSISPEGHLLLKGTVNGADDISLVLSNNNDNNNAVQSKSQPQSPHKIIITNIQKNLMNHNNKRQRRSRNKDKASDQDHSQNDNASFKSSKSFVTHGSKSTVFTSFTYGEQSTLNRSVKYLFSGNFSLKDMNMEDQSILLKQQQRLDNYSDNDASSYLSSHFGDLDGDEDSFVLDTDGLDDGDQGNEISGNREDQQNHHQDNEQKQQQQQQQQQLDTSNETEYISIEEYDNEYLNFDGEDSIMHQQQATKPNSNACNLSPVATPTPRQPQCTYSTEQDLRRENSIGIPNITLNTAEKDKDDRHRKKLLDVVTHNVIVAETNAQRMMETIESLRYQQLNDGSGRYYVDRQSYNYFINSLRDSSLYEESLHEYEYGDKYKQRQQQQGELTHEEVKNKKKNGHHNSKFGSINLKSFISLPKPNLFSPTSRQGRSRAQIGKNEKEDNCNDNYGCMKGLSPDNEDVDVDDADLIQTNYIASRQARIISDMIEPDCQKMEEFVWKNRHNNNGYERRNRTVSDDKYDFGTDNELWQLGSSSSMITPRKNNDRRRHRNIDHYCDEQSNDDDRWYVQTSPNIEGVYYYQPSTGAISREKPPTYHTMAYTNRKTEESNSYSTEEYLRVGGRNQNFDFLRLVSPIHPRKRFPKRKVVMNTQDNTAITRRFRLFVYISMGLGIFTLVVSVAYFGYQQYLSSSIGPQCSSSFYRFLSWNNSFLSLMTFRE